eukprot:2482656-Pyramimonas_sp.AAC.1
MLQSCKVTEVDDAAHDFGRLIIRMRDDDIQRFVDWDNLLLEGRDPPGTKIFESLFRAQLRRHPWMKQDMHDYNKVK